MSTARLRTLRSPLSDVARADAAGPSWLCCQLGAREHYAVPRALHGANVLAALVTDAWVAPGHRARLYPQRLRERFHPALSTASVGSFTLRSAVFEAQGRLAGARGWDLIVRRNEWFQDRALAWLTQFARQRVGERFHLFSFSYAAQRLFEFAKTQGWTTVLGQIDPGPADEHIVESLHSHSGTPEGSWRPAPPQYWRRWREECRLADVIVVNSAWAMECVLKEGVPREKLYTAPLVYDPPPGSYGFQRRYPPAFSVSRPLRVLVVGQMSLRKGIAAVCEAMLQLRSEPIEFVFVGPEQLEIPSLWKQWPRAQWVGPVSRASVAEFFRSADLFLFPTFSDGFGLTQLEAQAWRLPIVASRFCGDVVQNRLNGILLDEVSPGAIADSLRAVVADPSNLTAMSNRAVLSDEFSVSRLGWHLLNAAGDLRDRRHE